MTMLRPIAEVVTDGSASYVLDLQEEVWIIGKDLIGINLVTGELRRFMADTLVLLLDKCHFKGRNSQSGYTAMVPGGF